MKQTAGKEHTRGFADRLTYFRRRAGVSQGELALRIGLSNAETISRYERGVREPRVSTLIAIANALGISARCLIPEERGDESKKEWVNCVFKTLLDEGGLTVMEAEHAVRVLLTTRRGMETLASGDCRLW